MKILKFLRFGVKLCWNLFVFRYIGFFWLVLCVVIGFWRFGEMKSFFFLLGVVFVFKRCFIFCVRLVLIFFCWFLMVIVLKFVMFVNGFLLVIILICFFLLFFNIDCSLVLEIIIFRNLVFGLNWWW